MSRLGLWFWAVAVLVASTRLQAADLVPNDPYYSLPSPVLLSDGSTFTGEWYAPVLQMPTAWGISQGSSSVIVAVLDTGVWSAAPDLAGRVLPALSADPSGLAAPYDGTQYTHGTQVASVLAMGVNNGMGGAGVGNFSILPITVCSYADSANEDWVANGIRMAADAGARVINISYEFANWSEVDAAAAYARSKGALTFVAAGNYNTYTDAGNCPDLIFVAGTDEQNQRWVSLTDPSVGSNWGPAVTISAPASHLLVEYPQAGYPDGVFGVNSGTSFAVPLVAGAAALAWSINPDLTPDQVEDMLLSTATKMGTPETPVYPLGDYGDWNEYYGYGLLDIGAVAAAAEASLAVPEPATLGVLGLGAAGLLLRRGRRRAIPPPPTVHRFTQINTD